MTLTKRRIGADQPFDDGVAEQRGQPGAGACGDAVPLVTGVADLAEIYADGRTGIPGVDLWIRSVNPYGLASPSRVLSPDLRRPRTQQWP